MSRQKVWTWGGSLVGLALLAGFPFISPNEYITHIAITAFFYATLAASWSLLAGYAGQFSFGHMAFMAIGAYTTGIFAKFVRLSTAPTNLCSPEIDLGSYYLFLLNASKNINEPSCLEIAMETMPVGSMIYRLPVWSGIVLAIIMGGVFGLLVGALVLRLRRTYLALFTIGFSEIIRIMLNAEIAVTDGPNGLSLPPLFPSGIGPYSEVDKIPPYMVMMILFVGSLALMYWLANSRFGLFIRSIREDEEASAALGVHVVRYKVLVFTITSMIAAAAGAVFAHYVSVVTPNIMLILQMSLVISMAVIGGLESLIAAAIGAIIIEFALEFLRTEIALGPVIIDMTTWRLVFFGLLLMLTLRFWNNGLIQPIIQRITRAGVEKETVAKRQAVVEGDV
jgi:branched-chain amino acid transport system permease protein